MAWRKIHLGDEVWEWQTGQHVATYVIIRSPSRIATRVSSSKLGAVKVATNKVNEEGDYIMAYEVTPGIVKAYIASHREMLETKPEKRRKRER
jgi:hypothetical protein